MLGLDRFDSICTDGKLLQSHLIYSLLTLLGFESAILQESRNPVLLMGRSIAPECPVADKDLAPRFLGSNANVNCDGNSQAINMRCPPTSFFGHNPDPVNLPRAHL